MKRYTLSHEWVEWEGEVAKVGITHFAQEELGSVVYVQLPQVGQKVEQEQPVVVLESTKAAADIYTPLTGCVLEVNEALNTRPELINSSPENEGWLFTLKVERKAERVMGDLLDEKEYALLLEKS